MSKAIRDIMTSNLVTLPESATLADAARAMRDRGIGDVIVTTDGKVCGLVTDRDIVVRAIAQGHDPASTELGSVCRKQLYSVSPDDDTDHAIELMREKAVRRVAVLDGDQPVGIVSIGDLAQELDPRSALADISAAPANT
jgi:CBS domain-containing protein